MNYKTYAEAKIANPDCEIVTVGKDWSEVGRVISVFQVKTNAHPIESNAWVICNPADYCSTLKEFLDAGFELVKGDKFLGIGGNIVSVENTDASIMWDDEDDGFRYILSAAALNGGCKIPAKSEPWSIYNNTLPLSELSDEQAAQLFNAWRSNGSIMCRHYTDEVFVDIKDARWLDNFVYRIKPKSERDLFIEVSVQLMTSETERTMEQMFGAQFDAGARYKDLTQFFGENI